MVGVRWLMDWLTEHFGYSRRDDDARADARERVVQHMEARTEATVQRASETSPQVAARLRSLEAQRDVILRHDHPRPEPY